MKTPIGKDLVRARRRRLGQYFTSGDIARLVFFMLRRLGDLPPRPRLIDPACGEGVFIRHALGTGVTTPELALGCDIDATLSESWKTLPAHILHCLDGLEDHPEPAIEPGSFDLVVGNPPFGFDGKGSPRKEIAFLHRFIDLAAPGGQIAVILPEGVFANARTQALRDQLLKTIDIQAVIELPQGAFGSEGTAARTGILFARCSQPKSARNVLLGKVRDDWHGDPEEAIEKTLDAATTRLYGSRWNPRWWLWPGREQLDRCPCSVHRLGDFIEHITYGPILPGQTAPRADDGVVVINQKQLGETGLLLEDALRVPAGSEFDPPRCRIRPGDILMARCGAGSLPQAKLAVAEEAFVGTVSCFVDIIRLRGIEPRYVAAFLKSRYGRGQILRTLSGVGTPNLSFGEIRGLRIPLPPDAVQAEVAKLWRTMGRRHRDEEMEDARKLLGEAVEIVQRAVTGGNDE